MCLHSTRLEQVVILILSQEDLSCLKIHQSTIPKKTSLPQKNASSKYYRNNANKTLFFTHGQKKSLYHGNNEPSYCYSDVQRKSSDNLFEHYKTQLGKLIEDTYCCSKCSTVARFFPTHNHQCHPVKCFSKFIIFFIV